MYCYGIHQPLFDDMEVEIPNLEMKHGLPTPEEIEEFTKDRKHRSIIIDDLSHQLLNNQEMELLFTQGCHHRRLSVVFMTQNLFQRGSRSRTIALNTYYLVLMKMYETHLRSPFLAVSCFPATQTS